MGWVIWTVNFIKRSLKFSDNNAHVVLQTNEQPDVEKEVRRLFRMDCEAIDVKWEVVMEDPSSSNPDAVEKQVRVF